KPEPEPGASDPDKKGWKANANKEQYKFVTGVPSQTLTGHTGYLTAATLPPDWARPPRPTPEPAKEVAPAANP
ncbi:hypothetical protein L9F63_001369, partial [Diploptera punctata]